MSRPTVRPESANRLLSRLSRADFARLEPHLEAVDLPVRKMLEARNTRVEYAYFIEIGFASVVANLSSYPDGIEVGLIGKEGITGLGVILGCNDRAETDTYMQLAGSGRRIRAADLRRAIASSATLHQMLLTYVYGYLRQVMQTAAANGRGKIEERLARWLLMASDRAGDELQLTQEFLAIMLGIRRAGVISALQALEVQGLITRRRGAIAILDRDGLIERSKGTYVSSDVDW